jgi:protoporphyrinogen/coproporphyrinogen III oxidase
VSAGQTAANQSLRLGGNMKRIIIIGGGISGLAAAHRLLELDQPVQLTLLEASARLGGTIQTDHRDGFLIERGPDSFISEKPAALELVKRLGIEDKLIETNDQQRRSFIVRGGTLHPVPDGFQLLAPSRFWPFLSSKIFSTRGKLRMAGDLLLPRGRTNGTNDESLASFVRRRLGQEALERMAQPMAGGIYTANPETLSLRATLPRFLDLERDHRSIILGMWRKARALTGVSGARYSLFLSFVNGMETLVDALKEKLGETDVRLQTRVEHIEQTSTGWIVNTSAERFKVDAVCLAVPSFIAASLLKNVSPSLAAKLNTIKFASTATLNLAYRRSQITHPLDGFGFVVPLIEKRSLIACTFCNVKFTGRAPDETVLLRAFVGGALQPEMFALSDDEMKQRVQVDLAELLGIKGEPLFGEISRWTNSMPQYEVGHLDRVAAIEQELSTLAGLTLTGNSYHGPGIPDCIKSAERVATDTHG